MASGTICNIPGLYCLPMSVSHPFGQFVIQNCCSMSNNVLSTMYGVGRPMDKNVHPLAGHTSAQWGFLHGMLNGAQQLPAYNS